MIKNLTREIVLAIQAKSGLTAGLFVGLGLALIAALIAFAFLSVAGYVWLLRLFGGVFAGLIAAGFFFVVAALSAIFASLARNRARQRAILERAARAQAAPWLFDPKMLSAIAELGRSVGWRRLVSVALFGFLAAQWARERRDQDRPGDDNSG